MGRVGIAAAPFVPSSLMASWEATGPGNYLDRDRVASDIDKGLERCADIGPSRVWTEPWETKMSAE